MKKNKLKLAVKKALEPYYKSGFTNTANNLYLSLIKEIDKAYTNKK